MKPISAELSVIVPFWNEAPNVVPLAKRIFTALANEPRQIEVIFVDDASTDGTWERMLEAQQLDFRVRAVRHLKHGGQSAALWTGFRASRGGVVATLDGDLQNDPADLPAMFVELAGCDLVCGVRTRRLDSWLRRLSSRVARAARKLALGVDFRDTGRCWKHSLPSTASIVLCRFLLRTVVRWSRRFPSLTIHGSRASRNTVSGIGFGGVSTTWSVFVGLGSAS